MAGMVTPGERTTVLIGWAAIAASELALARVLTPQPSLAGALIECLVLLGLGALHAWLSYLKVLRGPFSALGWALALGALIAVDGPTRILSVMGVGFIALGIGYAGADLEERLPWVGAPLAVLAAPLVPCGRLLMEIWYGGHGDVQTTALAVVDGLPWLACLLPAALLGAWKDKLALALLVLAPALALDIKDPIPERSGSIVLITVDTLRKDAGEAMHSYAALAEHGDVFTDATASSTWTLPALASLHTGLDPASHGGARVGTGWLEIRPVDPSHQTLAEYLSQEGLDTAAVVTNPFVGYGLETGFGHWRNLSMRAPLDPVGLGLAGRGFDLRSTPRSPGDARRVVDEAFRWLDHTGDDPVFLWLHFLDPHLPYHHVEAYDDVDVRDLRQGRLRPEARPEVQEAYQREVDYVDREITTFLDGLESRGLGDALIVLTSDHGEEFWESGGVEHGHAIVEEVVQVPLVVRWGSDRPPRVSRDKVSQVDLLPSLLDHLGLTPPAHLDGEVFGQRRAARVVQGTLYDSDLEATVGGRVNVREPEAAAGGEAPGGLEALGYVE